MSVREKMTAVHPTAVPEDAKVERWQPYANARGMAELQQMMVRAGVARGSQSQSASAPISGWPSGSCIGSRAGSLK